MPLLFLLRLQGRALVRRLTRGIGTVKGALLFVFGLGTIALWLLPSILGATGQPATDPEVIRTVTPVALLAACLLNVVTSGGAKAIAFTPAEVDFLFPAPFSRRAVLAYKIGKSVAGIAFSALLLSAAFGRHAGGWGQAVIAAVLGLLFMQLFSMAVALVAQSAGARAFTLGRKVVVGAVAVVVAIPLAPVLLKGNELGMVAVARALHASPVGAAVLAPLESFGRIFTAARWFPDVAVQAGIALAIDAALLWVVFWLDADYLEAAAVRSAALHDRVKRLRQGGLLAAGGAVRARWTLPALPYWGGAGPIVWRQAVGVIRGGRSLLLALGLIAVIGGPTIRRATAGGDPTTATLGALAWATLMLVAWLRFDFRADLERMDHLKSLPAARWAVAAGQLAVPTALLCAVHQMILAGVMVAAGRAPGGLLLAAAVSAPASLFMVGIENVLFLYFPARQAAGVGDFQGFGRQMLTLVAKLLLVLAAVAVAGAAGWATHLVTGSLAAAGAVGLAVVVGLSLATVWWAGIAFSQFDVTVGAPE